MAAVVDLFCGVGGLTHGFMRHGGFDVVAGIDVDKTCEFAYKHNNPGTLFFDQDVEHMTGSDLNRLFPEGEVKILVGCAPCQPFSSLSSPHKKAVGEDGGAGKWRLVPRFAELIRECRPHVVSMENVPALEHHPSFTTFCDTLNKEGYEVWWGVIDCVEYGVPQTRSRLVLLASRLGKITFVAPTHSQDEYVTVRDAIGNLRPIAAGGFDPIDPLHRSSKLSPLNLRRIRASVPGGTWRDWPDELILDCHRRATGETFISVYGRMVWDAPSGTLTTQCNGIGNGRFGHPEQDRAISLREAALLQTFPEDYEFVAPDGNYTITDLARHIGNAVPVRLGEAIARSIEAHLAVHRRREQTQVI